ncbi:MAG: hypothetical protein JWN59_1625, partial [Sphingomonas bacterium]|nr:hypothetical protein [Sphingomonas bacterium]
MKWFQAAPAAGGARSAIVPGNG